MGTPPSETQRLATALSHRIRTLAPGDELGSVRSIAGQYGVSADVARRALGLLVQHGQVKAEARRHVVADPAAGAPTLQELAARLEALEHDVADLRTQLAAPSGSRRAAPDSD